MEDESAVSFFRSHEIFTRWIKSCIQIEQLIILNDIVDDFFSLRKFPDETKSSIYIACLSLRKEIDDRLQEIEPQLTLLHEN